MGDEAGFNDGQVALLLIGGGVGIQRAVDRPASMTVEEFIKTYPPETVIEGEYLSSLLN